MPIDLVLTKINISLLIHRNKIQYELKKTQALFFWLFYNLFYLRCFIISKTTCYQIIIKII
ncbi:hypothetical protein DCO46_19360 [Flavobacterium sp. HTF]|nr:hypothetical protein DCO46_19360 [Flavobacterium sp. HTF]